MLTYCFSTQSCEAAKALSSEFFNSSRLSVFALKLFSSTLLSKGTVNSPTVNEDSFYRSDGTCAPV